MLIIFDLDDTLIDTSGCITPHKLESGLSAMVSAGLPVSDFKGALTLLQRLDRTADSARSALSEFIELIEADAKYFTVGVKEIYDSLPVDIPIYPLEGAIELLREIGNHHQLALVTVGKSHIQMEKLKKAGIDSGIFSKIVVSEEKNKRPHYQNIVEELGYGFSDVLVCGDRILNDLVPARELGCKTVHIRWGRGLNSTGFTSHVDYCIVELKELKPIIASLMTFSSF